jgi:hypothetical protein
MKGDPIYDSDVRVIKWARLEQYSLQVCLGYLSLHVRVT